MIMKKTLAVSVISILCCAIMPHALAASYTAKQSESNKKTTSRQNKVEQCSHAEKVAMDKFERKAKRYLKDIAEYFETDNKPRTARDFISGQKRVIEKQDLFVSEEYRIMEKLFAKCGREIPRYEREVPFWAPPHYIDK